MAPPTLNASDTGIYKAVVLFHTPPVGQHTGAHTEHPLLTITWHFITIISNPKNLAPRLDTDKDKGSMSYIS